MRIKTILRCNARFSTPILNPSLGTQVCCIITRFFCHKAEHFRALSYEWGPPAPQHSIFVNGYALSIRENLYHFLQTVQRDSEFCRDTVLFIDQICVDQSNVEERNHQVSQMATIYSSAQQVIIWLGRESSESIAFVQGFSRCRESGESLAPGQEFLAFLPVPLEARLAMYELLASQTYWNRLWILQEVLLAKNLMLFWGASRLAWNDLTTFLFVSLLRQHLQNCRNHTTAPVKRRGLEMIRIARETRLAGVTYNWTWHQAIIFSQGSQCEDRRDKIFGLLGLIDRRSRIIPDYSKPLEDVFVEIVELEALRIPDPEQYKETEDLWRKELGIAEGVELPYIPFYLREEMPVDEVLSDTGADIGGTIFECDCGNCEHCGSIDRTGG